MYDIIHDLMDYEERICGMTIPRETKRKILGVVKDDCNSLKDRHADMMVVVQELQELYDTIEDPVVQTQIRYRLDQIYECLEMVGFILGSGVEADDAETATPKGRESDRLTKTVVQLAPDMHLPIVRKRFDDDLSASERELSAG